MTIPIFVNQDTKPSPHCGALEIPRPGISCNMGLEKHLEEMFAKHGSAIIRTLKCDFNALLEFTLHFNSSLHHS